MELTVLDQTVKIQLDTAKRIGILLSGGMDSAIMLFLILKEIADNKLNVDLTVYNVPNVNDNAIVYSRRVVDYLERHFNTVIKLVNIGDGRATPLKLIKQPAAHLLESGQVDVLYSGQNQFPPEAQAWTAYQEATGGFVRRNPNEPDSAVAKFPFIKLYKHHILDIYRQFNLLELAAITHSCTAQKEGRCEQCLWCVERAWAFSKLGLTDESL